MYYVLVHVLQRNHIMNYVVYIIVIIRNTCFGLELNFQELSVQWLNGCRRLAFVVKVQTVRRSIWKSCCQGDASMHGETEVAKRKYLLIGWYIHSRLQMCEKHLHGNRQ